MEFIDLQAQRRRLQPEIDKAISEVLEHGHFIMGPEVAAFEQELATYTAAEHVVSCANGTDALVLALRALGVTGGDRVVVPSFTFAATAEAVALIGAVPVFADVSADTYNADVESVAAAVEAHRAVGVIPVDLFGVPAPYDRLRAALPDEVFLLADAAQSIGGMLDGRPVGSLVDVTTTSFFPAKPLGCYGDGGAVLTQRDDVAEEIRSLRVHGKGSHKYDNERIGTNSRLDTLQAAILRCKLTILEDEMQRRQVVAARYATLLGDVVAVPSGPGAVRSAWAQYTVRSDRRDLLSGRLKDAGIPTAVYYPMPLHRQTAYRDFPVGPTGCAMSESLSAEVLSLPMHPYLGEDEQQQIADAVLAALA